MTENMWDLKVRTAKSDSMFIRNCAQGIWGSKKLKKRTLTGVTRAGKTATVEKRKATPKKVQVVKGEFLLLLLLIKCSKAVSCTFYFIKHVYFQRHSKDISCPKTRPL